MLYCNIFFKWYTKWQPRKSSNNPKHHKGIGKFGVSEAATWYVFGHILKKAYAAILPLELTVIMSNPAVHCTTLSLNHKQYM